MNGVVIAIDSSHLSSIDNVKVWLIEANRYPSL